MTIQLEIDDIKTVYKTTFDKVMKVVDEFFIENHGFGLDLTAREKSDFKYEVLRVDDKSDDYFGGEIYKVVKNLSEGTEKYYADMENLILSHKSFKEIEGDNSNPFSSKRDYSKELYLGPDMFAALLHILCREGIIEAGEYEI